MPKSLKRNALPWVLTAAVVAVLLALWLELYMTDVGSIATGAARQIDRNSVLDKSIVDYSGLAAALIVAAGVLVRIRNRSVPLLLQEIFQKVRAKPASGSNGEGANGGWGTVISVAFRDVLLLGKMGECEDFQQWASHFLIMWGFIGLAVTTTLDAIVNSAAVPLPITHPVRLLGNATGIVFMAGLTLSISRRVTHEDVRSSSRAGDWAFLIAMFGTAATGFAVQFFADTSSVLGVMLSYPVHLAFLSILLVSAPWSKFVHALWRPSWIVYSRLAANESR